MARSMRLCCISIWRIALSRLDLSLHRSIAASTSACLSGSVHVDPETAVGGWRAVGGAGLVYAVVGVEFGLVGVFVSPPNVAGAGDACEFGKSLGDAIQFGEAQRDGTIGELRETAKPMDKVLVGFV